MKKSFPTYYCEGLRNEMLEISDNRILWKMNIQSDEEYETYLVEVEEYRSQLERHYHTPFYLCGRSGRHVCIEDTPTNRRNYCHICRKVDTIQKELIKKHSHTEC